MNLRLLLALFLCFSLLSCKTGPVLKDDPYPATMDGDVLQSRLEFQGCGLDVSVGSIVCFPKDVSVKVRTDFPGTVIVLSKGSGCSRQDEHPAKQPYTEIALPKVSKICSVSLFYRPSFIPKPDKEIRGIIGELIQYPADDQVYLGAKAYTLYQDPELILPSNIKSGWYINRNIDDPESFQGNIVAYVNPGLGTDLVQVKGFDVDKKPFFYLYTVNYYSPKAKSLNVTLSDAGNNKVRVTLSEEVTAVMIGSQLEFWSSFNMDRSFVGIIRAYTINGRTLVFKLNKGVIEWSR